jgi:hypothetical protein
MTQTISDKNQEEKENRKERKDNIFLEILSNIFMQLPVVIIAWIISQFTSD